MKINKAFAIYKQPIKQKGSTWELHSKYATVEQASQAWKDVTKKPRKVRYYRYVVLPLLDSHVKKLVIKDEYSEDVLRMSK